MASLRLHALAELRQFDRSIDLTRLGNGVNLMHAQIPCKTCDSGHLTRRKKYRMSGVVVLIGYLILFPSFLGIAIGTMGIATTVPATQAANTSMQEVARARLHAAGVPTQIVDRVAARRVVPTSELSRLSAGHREAVEAATLELSAGAVGVGAGAVLVGGASLVFGVMSLVGGLLGWLLVMKKRVLQCGSCGVVVAAS